ncbi:hypothetical protein HNP24_001807 [Chryseobacterium sediminis]|uniref:DUF1853 family protein n=1 Tax=Chryseobacterium sediminis TaxID=1679494 RepID=A0ABR6Q0R1_9FLAO|nr:hypothetical protein [Chryseobacterium sediminis]MBB6330857.1 hypothetical protein [Chryseobacterium sediminis]
MIPDKLNFELPAFNRISWVSEALRSEWEPVLAVLPEMIDGIFTSDQIVDLVPIQIKSISVNDLFSFKKQIISKGLFAEQINDLPTAILLYFGLKNEEHKNYVVFGKRYHVLSFLKGIQEQNYDTILEYLHPPTLLYWTEFSKLDLIDNTWALLAKTDGIIDSLTRYPKNVINPLWSSLGMAPIPYFPAFADCQHSLEIASAIQALANETDHKLACSWTEILSWPIEWSAMHGIAEIKTPIFKRVYNTDSTAKKYVLRLESEVYPEKGLNGLLFPYRKPKKLYYTDSKHAQVGTQHLSDTL